MTPITRREAYLAYIAGTYSGDLPAPVTREEQYLYDIAVNGSGSAVQADWQQDDATAKDYIKNKPVLGTAAEKDSTNAVTANSTDLVESGAVKVAINEAISGLYFPAGDITCAELIPELLINDNLGKVYNATDSGLSTTYFVGGAGKTINAGDNIAIVNTGTVENPVYLFDNFTGLVDLSTYQKKLLTTPIIVDGTETTTVESALNAINTYAEENSDNISDIQSIIPSDASAQNPLATIHDVTEENIKSSSTTSPLTDSADGMVQGMTVYGASRTSKNLLEITAETRTINGVTFTVDKVAGTITANGTPTSGNVVFDVNENMNTTGIVTTISSSPAGASSNTFLYQLYRPYSDRSIEVLDEPVEINAEKTYPFTIRIFSGYTANNLVFRPMICTSADYEADPTFEPYFEGIKSVGDNGLTVTTANSDNTLTTSTEFTTALPLRSVSDTVRDKLICTADSKQVETVCWEVDLGELSWTKAETSTSGVYRFNCYEGFIACQTDNTSTARICSKYKVVGANDLYNGMSSDKTIAISGTGLWVRDDSYSDAATFKTAVTGIKLVYPLATPTTTPLTDTEISAFRGLRTFDSTTNITITDNPEFEIDYLKNTENGEAVADVQAGLQSQLDSSVPLSMIAPEFDSAKTYAVGDYVIYSRQLYKCTTAVETAGAWDSSKWTITTVTEILSNG